MHLTEDKIREIIDDEIIVDCYSDEEANLGWMVYMEDNMNYPFNAEYKVKYSNGDIKWERVKVLKNESCESNYRGGAYYVEIEFKEIIFSVKLNELRNIEAGKETMTSIQIWKHKNKY